MEPTPTTPGNPHIQRVRRLALTLPDTAEKLSHGEPTFFVRKKTFVMFANNHHNDGHTAIWIPAAPGAQAEMIAEAPETYFKPPYVGVKGWVGVELTRISDEDLAQLIRKAWQIIAPLAPVRRRR
jgi:hypothetical protein